MANEEKTFTPHQRRQRRLYRALNATLLKHHAPAQGFDSTAVLVSALGYLATNLAKMHGAESTRELFLRIAADAEALADGSSENDLRTMLSRGRA